MWRHEDFDASGDAWLTANKGVSFERDDHLVDRRWTDAEVVLQVCFGWWPSEHARVGVDESEVVALLFGESRGA